MRSDADIAALDAVLVADPEDTATLSVLGDALAERGDPRGELIALSLVEDRLGEAERRRLAELRAQLVPPIPQENGNVVRWGFGFVRELELGTATCARLGDLGPMWRHASLRKLQSVVVSGWKAASSLFYNAPRSLRAITIHSRNANDMLETLVGDMPHLEVLRVDGQLGPGPLRSRSLVHLRLDPHAWGADFDPRKLPALREVTLGLRTTDRFGAIAQPFARWTGAPLALHVIGIHGPERSGAIFDDAGVDAIRAALGDRRFASLDVSDCPMLPSVRAALATLAAAGRVRHLPVRS